MEMAMKIGCAIVKVAAAELETIARMRWTPHMHHRGAEI